MHRCFLTTLLFSVLLAPGALWAKSLQTLNIDFGWHPNSEFTGILIAQKKGWYAQEGIDLNIFDKRQKAAQLIDLGQIHIGIASEHLFMRTVSQGYDFQSFGVKFQTVPNCIVVDQNSSIQRVEDLRGKKLGYYHSSDLDYYRAVLKHHKIPLKEVTFVKTKKPTPEYVIKSFASGEFDSMISWEANLPVQLALLGYPARAFRTALHGYSLYGSLYFAKRSFIEKNQDLLRRFLKVTLRGWQYTLGHIEELSTWVTKDLFPKDSYLAGSFDLTRKQQKAKLMMSVQRMQETVGNDHMLWFSTARWLQNSRVAKEIGLYQIDSNTDPLSLITFNILRSLKSDAGDDS